MPFKRIIPDETATHPELVDAIAKELRDERPDGLRDAPEIVEELVPHSQYFYVTVIWDTWEKIGHRDRGRVIMDAYQKVRGVDETLKISAALGLTHQEASRLGKKSYFFDAAGT